MTHRVGKNFDYSTPRLKLFKYLLIALVSVGFLSSCQYIKPLIHPQPSSELEHISPESSVRNNVVQYAYSLLGSKYKYGGKSSVDGFDCSGFVCHVLNKNGIALSGPSYALENCGRKISLGEVKAGDLLFFKRTKGGRVFHVALVASNENGKTKIIHASSGRGVVLDVLEESSYWSSKIATARDVISKQN